MTTITREENTLSSGLSSKDGNEPESSKSGLMNVEPSTGGLTREDEARIRIGWYKLMIEVDPMMIPVTMLPKFADWWLNVISSEIARERESMEKEVRKLLIYLPSEAVTEVMGERLLVSREDVLSIISPKGSGKKQI